MLTNANIQPIAANVRIRRTVVCVLAAASALMALPAHAQQVPLPLPPPPAIPPVTVPPALQQVAGIASPTASPVCGLVTLLPGLIGQEAGTLPFDARPLVPYLAPILVACGAIPPASDLHSCAVDAQLTAQVAAAENRVFALLNVLPVPQPEGIVIDTLLAADAAAGGAIPPDALQQLSDALGCKPIAGAGATGTGAPVVEAPVPPVATPAVAAPLVDAGPAAAFTGAIAQAASPARPAPEIRAAIKPVVAPVKLQHWRPLITTLVVLFLIALFALAWRAERRDARRWTS
jgi:hypothetical protein